MMKSIAIEELDNEGIYAMPTTNSKSVNVYMSLDKKEINSYFNKYDPAPIYKRQLSHQFEQYIMTAVHQAKRHDPIFYKFCCSNDIEQQYAEPLLYAIRRHFMDKKIERVKAFERFKKRNWVVLLVSVIVVLASQIILPLILKDTFKFESAISHSMDVFSWVILWHPIDELIFNWNPHLKEICLLNKLTSAESIIIVENEKKVSVPDTFRVVA